MELQEPLFGVEWNCRSLGFARDDKKERVVERERTVAEGQGSCWGGGGRAFSIDNRPLYRHYAFVRNQKVKASQDEDFVRVLTKKHPKEISAYGASLGI